MLIQRVQQYEACSFFILQEVHSGNDVNGSSTAVGQYKLADGVE